jgi:hypothetical protein
VTCRWTECLCEHDVVAIEILSLLAAWKTIGLKRNMHLSPTSTVTESSERSTGDHDDVAVAFVADIGADSTLKIADLRPSSSLDLRSGIGLSVFLVVERV